MSFPDDRIESYDPALVWDWPTDSWIADDGRGGARYKNTILVMSYNDDGNGVIYYGEV